MLALFRLLSLRHFRLSPFRAVLVAFGIALGVATLVSIAEVNRAILRSFHESVDRVGGRAELVVSNGDVGVDAELVESLGRLPEVEHVAGVVEIAAQRPGLDHRPILLVGVDFLGDTHFMPIRIEEGADAFEDPLAVINDPSAILISRALAANSRVGVGDGFELLTPKGIGRFTVRGILEASGLASSFGGEVAVMYLDAAQVAFHREDRVDRIDISLRARTDPQSARSRILSHIDHRARVEPPEGRTRQLARLFDPIARSLDVSGLVALLVGMFLIYNAIGVAVAERQREIGVLRALGATRRTVSALFALEAAAFALSGSAAGVLAGHMIASIVLEQASPTVSRFYAPIRPPPPELTPVLASAGILVGVVTTLLAAYWPARIAASRDPSDTLHHQAKRTHPRALPSRRMLAVGIGAAVLAASSAKLDHELAGFVAIGLFLLAGVLAIPALVEWLHRPVAIIFGRVLGASGRIGADYVLRSPGRTTVTVAALMTAVGLSVGMRTWAASLESAMMRWLDQALPADVYVTAGSPVADQHNTPFAPEVMNELEGVSGVRASYPFRSATLDVRDRRVQLISLDARLYLEELERKGTSVMVVDGDVRIDPDRLVSRRGILIGESAARGLGLAPNDVLVLDTPTGSRSYEVIAVIVDYTSVQGTIILDRRWYLEDFRDARIDTIDLFLSESAKIDAVAGEVRARLGRGPSLYVVSAAEIRREFRQALGEALAIFRSVDLVGLTVALLGVVGTMLAVLFDRIRDIGVLRAIGASRGQVIAAFAAEAVFLGFVASVGGAILGIPLGWVLVRVIGVVNTGWQIAYEFPVTGVLRIGGAITLTAALAGLIPGRRAARLDPARALEHE